MRKRATLSDADDRQPTDDDELLADDDEPTGGGTAESAEPGGAGRRPIDEEEDDVWDDEPLGMPREKAIRLAQIGLVVLAVVVILFVVLRGGDDKDDSSTKNQDGSSQSTDGGATEKPKKAAWPAEINNKNPKLGGKDDGPAQVPADAPQGVYLWSDFQGWHLWVVQGDALGDVTGTITSNVNMAKAELAVADAGTVNTNATTSTFALPGGTRVTGIDFNPGFYSKQVAITLQTPDGPVDAKLIKIGSKGAEAPTPIIFEKAPGN